MGVIATLAVAATGSCGGGARPACLSSLDSDTCTPLYPADFPTIYRQIFAPTCAAGGVACHSGTGRVGELKFGSEAETYDGLLGLDAVAKARVVPGNAACSELVVRLDSPGHEWSMPPGSPLDERARCSIRRWVAGGAARMP
jgi:hypothetical protein